uniref:Uncharacterized protein n=1 Tax=Romanomermis culicivorax TaxID=13658 RepID=A0A915JAB2_ROMCU
MFSQQVNSQSLKKVVHLSVKRKDRQGINIKVTNHLEAQHDSSLFLSSSRPGIGSIAQLMIQPIILTITTFIKEDTSGVEGQSPERNEKNTRAMYMPQIRWTEK